MKRKLFDRVIREVLGPPMKAIDFEYDKLTFFRELPTSVIHLVGLEFDSYSTETFQVMCGVNSRKVEFYSKKHPFEMGYCGAQHLTPDGWNRSSGFWPCKDEQELKASLNKIEQLVQQLAEPWFQDFQTLSSVAELMDTQHPGQGIDKAKLFLEDGESKKAESTLREFLQRLASPKRWDDPSEFEKLKVDAQILLQEIAHKA